MSFSVAVETHYTATIVIAKVEKRPPGPKDYGDREITEVVRIALKGKDLGSLKAKIAAHVALVEEES